MTHLDVETGTLIYEGHDVSRRYHNTPKSVDQPMSLPSGAATDNGKFFKAATDYKEGQADAERIQVYEKIMPGI